MNNRRLAMVRRRVKGREAKKTSPAALAEMLYPWMVRVMMRALRAGGCKALTALWFVSGANNLPKVEYGKPLAENGNVQFLWSPPSAAEG